MRLLCSLALVLFNLQWSVFAYSQSHSAEMIAFDVFLDEKSVGTHSFTIQRSPNSIKVESNMQLKGRFWGLVPFKYTHQSTEQWEKGCLVNLQSKTLKRGKIINVSAISNQSVATIVSADKTEVVEGCVRTFAYWDLSLLQGDQLLNTENGKLVDVEIEAAQGQGVEGKSIVIRSSEADINLEYAADGKWLSLKSVLEVGGLLHYIRQ